MAKFEDMYIFKMLSFVGGFLTFLYLCVFLRMLEIFKDSNVRLTVTLQCVVTVTSVGQFRTDNVTIVWGNKVRAGCVLLIEQLNSVLPVNNLTQPVMQSACCLLTSCGDVTKCVVISNNESSAAYCHSRRRSTDRSSDSQLRTFRWWAHWWSHQKLPAVMETKIPSPLSQQRTTFPYSKPH